MVVPLTCLFVIVYYIAPFIVHIFVCFVLKKTLTDFTDKLLTWYQTLMLL